MGYFIRKRKKSWALFKTRYEGGRCLSKKVPVEDYRKLSFRSSMNEEEAKFHASALNQKLCQDKWREKRRVLDKKLSRETEEPNRYLPPSLSEEYLEEIETLPDPKRFKSFWRAARKLIREVDIPSKDWKRRAQAIYNYFEKNHLSPEYAKKIIRLMNLWGEFYASKTNTSYFHLKAPTGFARGRISRSYRQHLKTDKASDGLMPEILDRLKGTMDTQHYNWLFISLWFGLRPQEIENLGLGADYWYFDHDPESGFEILNIKQTKLCNLPDEEQWKMIPLVYQEQRKAAFFIRNGDFKRPLPRTIKRHTGGNHLLYAGRKGFGPLMWERGHDVVEVSSWLGHKSIDRTYKDYMRWKKLKLRRNLGVRLECTGNFLSSI